MRTMNQSDVGAICGQFRNGAHPSRIAEQLGISESDVLSALRRHYNRRVGTRVKRKRHTWTTEEEVMVMDEYRRMLPLRSATTGRIFWAGLAGSFEKVSGVRVGGGSCRRKVTRMLDEEGPQVPWYKRWLGVTS
jgi:hypothetical protein